MIKLSPIIIGKGEVKGITFTLIKRNGLDAMYKRSDGYFEVIKIIEQKAKTRILGGKEITTPDKEVYPRGEWWGIKGRGKCVGTIDVATKIFNERIKDDTATKK